MSTPSSGSRKPVNPGRNKHVTRSGKTIKINRSLGERLSAQKNAKANRKAARLATLPKGRIKRFLYHFQPRRMYKYWFSRDGAIMALKIMGVGFIATFLLLVGLFAYFRKDLPNLRDINGDQFGGSIRYFDRTGQTLLWEDYDAMKRIPVGHDGQNQFMRDATVAIEDKDFFHHGGFDVRGIMRAGVNNLTGRGNTQGGSTITQQLVKLTQNWTKDHSYTRKAKELILSVELERSYSKQEILAGYLDTAPYGNVQYGVEAATRDYFHKSAKDLTLDEAAFMAAIPQSPSFYSPYGAYFKANTTESTTALKARQHYILNLMYDQKMITKKQRDDAQKIDTLAKVQPQPQDKYAGIKAPYFVLAAKKQLEEQRGGVDSAKVGGWTVTTTLDLSKQELAEQQVQKGLAQVKRQGGDEIAFAAEDVKTGQMVALVGGVDFNDPDHGKFNYATSPLPPGSSFKPYDYTTLIDTKPNVGAGSVIYDTQGPINGGSAGSYPCTNKKQPKQDPGGSGFCLWDYDFYYPGPLTLRYALGGSRNVPAVKAMLMSGVDKTISTAEKLGLKSGYKCYADEQNTKEAPCYLSAAIGDGAYLHLDEHVHGYASLSRNGLNIPQTYILKITNASGKTISEWKPSKGTQVVKAESAYIVDDMLSDPNASYFPAGRKPHRYKGWKFAMKTGTTNDAKDGWMMGFSPQYAAGVWVGYHTRQKVMSGTMEAMTQPVWQGWMDKAHDDIKPFDRVRPAGIQTLPAYVVRSRPSNKTAGAVIPSTSTDLFPSWYKPTAKTVTNQVIDKVSGKLATDCTPDLAKEKSSNASANQFSIDTVITGGAASGSNTGEQDDVHKCDDIKPSIGLNITANGNSYLLSVDVTQGTHPISSDKFTGKVNYIVDGQIVQSVDIGGPGAGLASYTYTPTFTGSKPIYAQVIDSALYDASSSEGTITNNGVSDLTVKAIDLGSGNVSVSWTGGTGTISIFRASNSGLICSALATAGGCPGTYPKSNFAAGAYAKDGSGATATVSGP
jgi:penicillin-binding protein 1A